MKRKRLLMILQLISECPISTQEELIKHLSDNGFDVTQATVSRDIKELKLVKTTDSQGRYRYSVPDDKQIDGLGNYNSLLSSNVVDVKYACNMVCVLCTTGTAPAVCYAIDELKSSNIIGTLAGDDTIFIMCANEQQSEEVSKMIKKLARKE